MIFGRTDAQRRKDREKKLDDADEVWTRKFAWNLTILANGQMVWLGRYWEYTRVLYRLNSNERFIARYRYIKKEERR